MQLGICVQLTEIETLEERLAALRQENFSSCQLICWKTALFTPENAETIKKLLRKYSVTVSAFWCGWDGPCVWDFYDGQKTIGLVPPAYREMRVRNLCDGADFAVGFGVRDVVTHMGFIPEDPADARFEGFCDAVRTVAQHLGEQGQRLLFETGQETPVTMLRTFETVGCDNLGINLDTANLILYGRANPVDALDVFGRYVCNLHAKDGVYPLDGHMLGREARIGDGKVNFHALFARLAALGYDGPVTIEREISGEQQVADIRHARTYLSAVIKAVYGREPQC